MVIAILLQLLGGCAAPRLGVRLNEPPIPPAPAGVAHTAEIIRGHDGLKMFAQSWRPEEGEPRGVVIVMHGLRDHSGRYAAFAAQLVARGYAVHAFDLRGHGRSGGRRVTIRSFDDYLADFDRFVALVRKREPARPLFLFGHSMGGAIVTLWTELHPGVAAGIVLSAPAIRIDAQPVTAAATILANSFASDLGALAPDNRYFSSDPRVEAAMGKDPLIHQPAGPVHTALQLILAIERIWAGVDRLATTPVLCLHGTGDKLTAPAGCRDLVVCAGGGDKSLRLYEGQAHDLVHEPKRELIIGEVLAWLDAHTGGPPVVAPAVDLTRRLRGDSHKLPQSLAFEGGYRRGTVGIADAQFGGGALRSRVLVGRRVAYVGGLDGVLFGNSDGLVYRAFAFPAGIALVHPRGNNVSFGLGAGVLGVGDRYVFEVALALDAEVQLGPVRVLAWGRSKLPLGEVPLVDDLHVGLAVRLGRNHHFWSTTNAGAGPYLGVTWDRQWQFASDTVGVVFGIHLWGGH